MINLYRFMLWAAELELARAKKAPERNRKHIAMCQGDVDRWHKALAEARVNQLSLNHG